MAPSGEDDGAKLVVDEHVDLPDTGWFVSVTVHVVPESEAYPEGVKYSMHYGTYDGETILRYDNAHPEVKGHERHTQGTVERIDFPGWEALFERFRREVREREHDD